MFHIILVIWWKNENVKNVQTDGQRTTGDQKSFLECSAPASYINTYFFIHENMKSQFSVWKGTFQQPVTRGFTGTIARPVFLCLQMKQHDLDFPTREKGKTIILIFLFIRSVLYSCRKVAFILSVISRETSWTKNAVKLYLCILCLS